MSSACTPILVGVVFLVSEILLLSKTTKFSFPTMDYSPLLIKMADDIDLVCCSCNGLKRLCKGCACVISGRPCSNCLPDRTGRCHNRFGQSHSPSNESSVPEVVVGSGPLLLRLLSRRSLLLLWMTLFPLVSIRTVISVLLQVMRLHLFSPKPHVRHLCLTLSH